MRVHVLGAGIVGLSCADELLRRGHEVTVVDRAPGSGASGVAAGMLTPAGEAWAGEQETFALGVEAAALWPAHAARLEVPLHEHGTLLAGLDAGDVREVERRWALLRTWGLEVDLVDAAEVRRLEPTLSRVGAGLLLDDRAADPRAVLEALLRRLRSHPRGALVPERPAQTPDATLLATGWRLPVPHRHLVRGVRGEVLVLRPERGCAPTRVVRAWVAGEQVYLVPRPDGRLVVGATSEEHDGPAAVTAGGVLRLLRATRALAPALDGAALLETAAGNRPATPDHLPLLGPSGVTGEWLAAGTFRHGVLLSPLVARVLADQFEGAAVRPALDPRRFTPDLTRPIARREEEVPCS